MKRIILDTEMTSTKKYGQVYQVGILDPDTKNKNEWNFRPYALKVITEKLSGGNTNELLRKLSKNNGDPELIRIMRNQHVIDKKGIHPKNLYQMQQCDFRYDERKFPKETFGKYRNEILKAFNDADEIIGYNIDADFERLCYTASLTGHEEEFSKAMKEKLHDIMPEFSKYVGYENISFSLQEALLIMDVEVIQEHHALSDCIITDKLMDAMNSRKAPSYEKIIDTLNDMQDEKRSEKADLLENNPSFKDIYFAGMCESSIRKLQRKIENVTAAHFGIEKTYSSVSYAKLYGINGDGAPMGKPDDIFDECSRLKGVTYERACSEYFRLAEKNNWDISKYITKNVPEIRKILYDWNGAKNNTLIIKTIMLSRGKKVNDSEIRAAQLLEKRETDHQKTYTKEKNEIVFPDKSNEEYKNSTKQNFSLEKDEDIIF